MYLYLKALLVLGALLANCGVGPGSGGNKPQSNSSNEIVPPTVDSGSLINIASQFASYDPATGVASLISTDTLRPIWKRKTSSRFDGVYPLPYTDGLILYGSTGLFLITSEGERYFPMTGSRGGHWNVNAGYHLFANLNPSSFSISILKFNSGTDWHMQEVNAREIEPDSIFIGDEGDKVVAFNSKTNAYLIFSFDSNRQQFVESISCPNTVNNESSNSNWVAGLIEPSGEQRILLVNSIGELYFLPTDAAACVQIENTAKNPLDLGADLTSIESLGLGQISATYKEGLTQVFSLSEGHYEQIATMTFNCPHPISYRELQGDFDQILCLDSGVSYFPNTYQYSSINLISRNKLSGAEVSVPLELYKQSGIAIDRTTNKLYRMNKGRFGNLETVDLSTGQVEKNRGTFLENFFETL